MMKYVWLFLASVLMVAFANVQLACSQGVVTNIEQKFMASTNGQIVYGFCPKNRVDLVRLGNELRAQLDKVPDGAVHSSLQTLAEEQANTLDWSECTRKVIVYGIDTPAEQVTPFYDVAYIATDNIGYGVIGFCSYRRGIERALLAGDDGSLLEEAEAPARYRSFAAHAKKDLQCNGVGYVDVYGHDGPTKKDTIAQK